MEPTSAPAEVAAPRLAELARSVVECGGPARLRIAWAPGIGDVPYIPDAGDPDDGGVWLLLPDDRTTGWPSRDLTGVLHIDESGPGGVTVLIGGRLARVAGDAQHQLALALATLRPLGALLDVGRGVTPYRLAAAEVRITGPITATVDLAEYGVARPDPVRPYAAGVLGHLAREHREQLGAILRAHLGAPPGWTAAEVTPATLDRYGLELIYRESAGGPIGRIRVPFQAPIRGIEALGAALRAITPCECRSALDY
jgi:hypothetical protein